MVKMFIILIPNLTRIKELIRELPYAMINMWWNFYQCMIGLVKILKIDK